jgi:crotonobetainyl-CoA:carnitine CoA-transferase CaiB-like acyl-CoA transferase
MATVVESETVSDALPLSDLRVVECGEGVAAAFATKLMAMLGAEVIKVERPTGDVTRERGPFVEDRVDPEQSGLFLYLNADKRSVTLNLSDPSDRARLDHLLASADVLVPHCDLVVENFAPGVISRMGLGYEGLRELRSDLIMLSLSGYGQTGPYSRYVSYGGLLGAQSGLFSVSGYSNAQPLETGITYGDPNAGAFGAFAAVAALIHRVRTGQGQYIDLALWEALEFVMPEAWLEYQMNRREPSVAGNRDRWMAPHNCYKSLGDAEHWISIAVRDDDEWRSLCSAMDQPALAADPRFRTRAARKQNEDELDVIITRWTSRHDRWEATEILQRAGVAAMPTLSNKDLAHDPHLKQRGFLVELEHPAVGRRIHAGVPWTMSETPCQVRRPAPLLGADTDDVLTTLLGYSPDRIADLRRTGVLT